jgi:hypothetical protein
VNMFSNACEMVYVEFGILVFLCRGIVLRFVFVILICRIEVMLYGFLSCACLLLGESGFVIVAVLCE